MKKCFIIWALCASLFNTQYTSAAATRNLPRVGQAAVRMPAMRLPSAYRQSSTSPSQLSTGSGVITDPRFLHAGTPAIAQYAAQRLQRPVQGYLGYAPTPQAQQPSMGQPQQMPEAPIKGVVSIPRAPTRLDMHQTPLPFEDTPAELDVSHKQKRVIITANDASRTPQPQEMRQTTIATVAANPEEPGRLVPKKAVEQFQREVASSVFENAKIPQKDSSIIRVVTFNVHFWASPDKTRNHMQAMGEVITTLNPDILLLQEVSPNPGFGNGTTLDNSPTMRLLTEAGFTEVVGGNTVDRGWFGNVIATKSTNIDTGTRYFRRQFEPFETRCYVYINQKLPDNKNLLVYTTHLEVGGDDYLREKQIEEIIFFTKRTKIDSILIAGDFNATRDERAIKKLEEEGFKDCFSYMGWQHPYYTNWTGKEIDFIFLSPNWNLPLAGCYVYYSAASDHLPIILDIKVTA